MGHRSVHRAVMMAAQNALYLRMPGDDGSKFGGIKQIDSVHVADAADERRMVHDHDGWLAAVRRQRGVEPVQAG